MHSCGNLTGWVSVCRRGRMRSDDPLFGKGKWGHDGFEALSKEPEPVPMLW